MYGNTFFVCIISVVAEVIITFLSSFVLSRMVFKNKKTQKLIYGFLIMGLSISPFILLFPVYKINVALGLRGKLALIFPYIATSISFNTLLLVGYLKSLPSEIDEAAVIDWLQYLGFDAESDSADDKTGDCNYRNLQCFVHME